jgi:hypothetical protein
MEKSKVQELHDRAEEARAIANVLDVPDLKAMMRRLGDTYETLARREQARLDAAKSVPLTKNRAGRI